MFSIYMWVFRSPLCRLITPDMWNVASSENNTSSKWGFVSIRSRIFIANFLHCGLSFGFSCCTVCALYEYNQSCLCRTLCTVVGGTLNCLNAWRMDLLALLWNPAWISSTFSSVMERRAPPYCFSALPVASNLLNQNLIDLALGATLHTLVCNFVVLKS